MSVAWDENTPIYLQLKDRIVAMILDGILKPGDAVPSVRQVAAEYQLNPITVSRAYQELAEAGLVEKRRGVGMFVTENAPSQLLASEREQFLSHDWPEIVEKIRRLDLDWDALREAIEKNTEGDPS